MLAEDEAEFDKREKEVVALTKRLTTEQRTRYAAGEAGGGEVDAGREGAGDVPGAREQIDTRHLLHGAKASQREIDSPGIRRAVWSWIVKGREGMDIDEYRVLARLLRAAGSSTPSQLPTAS